MLSAPHAAAGAAIGALSGNVWIAVPAAVASHFVLDMVPHWQETLAPYTPTAKTYVRIPIDLTLAVAIVVLAVHWQPQQAAAIWAGAIGANLPDLDSLVVLMPDIKQGLIERFWNWHCEIQRETSSLWGILPQLIVIALSLALIKVL